VRAGRSEDPQGEVVPRLVGEQQLARAFVRLLRARDELDVDESIVCA
jgi:hypothetical protein